LPLSSGTPASRREAGRADPDWWRQAAVYQVYPRSFADSDADGIGDLQGLISRIGYLTALHVDAIWLSPFYPSALADGGYDVDDYRDVDRRLGTLDDFAELARRLHAAGLKVIVDIVPNHSSNRHRWFTAALAAGRGSPARDRYIFRDGRGYGGAQPPSDWLSVVGGPAWTQVPDGQWYLHLFTPEQPDLNWTNRQVRDDFLKTLRFWSDLGADGFRVDVAHGLAKDLAGPMTGTGSQLDAAAPPGSHPLWDRDEVHEIYAEWRQVFNEYDPPRTAVAEAWVAAARRLRYASKDGLGQAFNFDLLEAGWDAAQFRAIITDNLADARLHGSSTTWVLSNHDVVRHATRYGLPLAAQAGNTAGKAWLQSGGATPGLDHELGLRRAHAATMLMLALPGSAYLYQGEELGLHEVADLPADARQDPVFLRSAGADTGRDGCRVPLPWTASGPSFGFGLGPAHLPQPGWFGPLSVAEQEADPDSTLSLYRRALAWRRTLRAAEELDWPDCADPEVVHFRRPGGWHSVTNFGAGPIELPPGRTILASTRAPGRVLPPNATAWVLGDSE
jgi:alpha-glucosidase